MRIISGTLGGRKIQPPANMPHTRPTTDIAKGGLFNTLQNLIDLDGAIALDLFGGTGSITYELVSRGAAACTIVEQDHAMAAFIKRSISTLGIANKVELVQSEVFRYLQWAASKYDFIFAGPPYALATIDLLPEHIIDRALLNDQGIFVLEHTPRNNYEQHPNFFKTKNYGTTVFSYFKL